jgi:hypothetical protein
MIDLREQRSDDGFILKPRHGSRAYSEPADPLVPESPISIGETPVHANRYDRESVET